MHKAAAGAALLAHQPGVADQPMREQYELTNQRRGFEHWQGFSRGGAGTIQLNSIQDPGSLELSPLLAQFAQPRPSASQLDNLGWKSKAERE